MPKSKRRNMQHWPVSNQRARKLRQKGVVVFYWQDGRTGYRGMARMNPIANDSESVPCELTADSKCPECGGQLEQAGLSAPARDVWICHECGFNDTDGDLPAEAPNHA